MWKYIIYKYTNIINNKIYIGQTNNEQRRKREHFSCSIKKKKHKFNKAIDKYGIDNFKYEVMCYCKNRHEADLMEIFFILFSLILTIMFAMSGFLLISRFLIDIINNLW